FAVTSSTVRREDCRDESFHVWLISRSNGAKCIRNKTVQLQSHMLDFGSNQFQSSLADTLAWCKMKSVDANSEIGQQHPLSVEAEQQWEEARQIVNRGWFRRTIINRNQWRHATALLKLVRGPMARKFRSPELKPSVDLDEFGIDAPWAQAVAEVVAKRSL